MIFGLFFFPTPMALRSCLFHQLLRKFVIASIPTVPLFVFNLPQIFPTQLFHNCLDPCRWISIPRTVPRQIPRVRVPELLTVSRRILKILPNIPFCYSLAYRVRRHFRSMHRR
ncbi:hypothetical protein BDZ91DRAFT_753447 [Kalaharituber pfeilii]|nr:hypothetical protein BDZ91DRAFT_753447 [Kalaharituber pfeilii]